MNDNAVKIAIPHSLGYTPFPGSLFPCLQVQVQKGTNFLQVLVSHSGPFQAVWEECYLQATTYCPQNHFRHCRHLKGVCSSTSLSTAKGHRTPSLLSCYLPTSCRCLGYPTVSQMAFKLSLISMDYSRSLNTCVDTYRKISTYYYMLIIINLK